jgi:hypothetical protein
MNMKKNMGNIGLAELGFWNFAGNFPRRRRRRKSSELFSE